MRKLSCIHAIIILAVTALLPPAAMSAGQSQSTGWVAPDDAYRLSRSLKYQGLMPVKIECKGDSSSSFIRDSMMINVTFGPNTEHRPWKWRWGYNFSKYEHKLGPKGWKLVSQSGFTRPKTGLFVPCGIFVGPPGASAEFGPLGQ